MAKAKKSTQKQKSDRLSSIQNDFVTITSHQLRTPLSGSKWLLELLLKEGTGNLNKKQKDFIERLYASNEQMIALVNDLLEVSRIESGESKIYLQSVDLASIIRSMIKEKSKAVKNKNLNISLTIEQEPFPAVTTEPNRIKQAISNLLTNAINYTQEKGNINLDLKLEGKMAICSISDSGVGIPKEQQKQIFNKFFRANNVLNFETSGTGLGLFITKSFIEASGGKIWFKSEPGKGTTFFFTLPVAK